MITSCSYLPKRLSGPQKTLDRAGGMWHLCANVQDCARNASARRAFCVGGRHGEEAQGRPEVLTHAEQWDRITAACRESAAAYDDLAPHERDALLFGPDEAFRAALEKMQAIAAARKAAGVNKG